MSDQSQEYILTPEEIVLKQYSLLRSIFQKLSMRELLKCAVVSKTWLEVVEVTKSDKCRVSVSPGIFCWHGEVIRSSEVGKKENEDRAHASSLEKLKSNLLQTMVEPAFVISMISGHTKSNWSERESFVLDQVKFDRLFPKKCHSISAIVEGCVIMDENTWQLRELENHSFISNPSMSMMYFPQGSELKITPFHLDESTESIQQDLLVLKATKEEMPRTSLRSHLYHQAVGQHGVEAGDVKCVIALTASHESPRLNFILQEVCQETNHNVAIGGGVGEIVRSSDDGLELSKILEQYEPTSEDLENEDIPEETGNSTVGWAISGPNVTAASVLIGSDVRTEKKLATVLSELKSVDLKDKKRFAFMFACCGRGKNCYAKTNVESKAFRKMFPKVPLIGMFGQGEIGWTFIPNKAVEQSKGTFSNPGGSEAAGTQSKKRKRMELVASEDLRHAYSTVFVLVTY